MSETARLEIQISLMTKTQERQRNMIQGFQKSQSEFLDDLVAQDTVIADLKAEAEAMDDKVIKSTLRNIDLLLETKDQVQELALKDTKLNRQAETIGEYQDEVENLEARLEIAVRLMNQEASAFMICHYEDERREQGL